MAGLVTARTPGRIGDRKHELTNAHRAALAHTVLSGRKTGANMARLYQGSQPTISPIVPDYRGVGPNEVSQDQRSSYEAA